MILFFPYYILILIFNRIIKPSTIFLILCGLQIMEILLSIYLLFDIQSNELLSFFLAFRIEKISQIN